jgi:hypothetical protein
LSCPTKKPAAYTKEPANITEIDRYSERIRAGGATNASIRSGPAMVHAVAVALGGWKMNATRVTAG